MGIELGSAVLPPAVLRRPSRHTPRIWRSMAMPIRTRLHRPGLNCFHQVFAGEENAMRTFGIRAVGCRTRHSAVSVELLRVLDRRDVPGPRPQPQPTASSGKFSLIEGTAE